jgi:hypothetical protein
MVVARLPETTNEPGANANQRSDPERLEQHLNGRVDRFDISVADNPSGEKQDVD